MPDSIMKDFFLATVAVELHSRPETFWDIIKNLAPWFPKSMYIRSQQATAYYELKGNDTNFTYVTNWY